jgi:seryl-tRNA synthetase
MLDVNDLCENLDRYATQLARRRMGELDLAGVRAVNEQRKRLQKERDDLVCEQRDLGPQIAQKKKAGEDAASLTERSTAIKERIKAAEQELKEAEAALERRLLLIPNLPHPDAPDGGEADGVVRRTWGQAAEFAFAPKDHVALVEQLGLVDLGERATRLSGASFIVLRGLGARLERALINFFLDLHGREHGYTEISPPFVVNERALTGTGQLPKFREELYAIGADGLFLIPTAEVPVTNLHQEEILDGERLPFGYCAYSPCFRREAGAAGKMTRGMKRLHQFDKVELVRFARPEESDAQHQLLLSHCEEPLRRLGIHYRIKELAAGDTGFSAARCYDIEAWAPGGKEWLEVSSVSVFTDYQARRANIRFKDKPSAEVKKPRTRFVHTLNGSGLALPRVVICLLETHQQADGTVLVPAPLRPYLGGLERLAPPAS